MDSNRHKAAALCKGVVIGAVTAIGLFWGWFLLGAFTGVFGMCTSASEGWTTIFIGLSLLIPVVSLAAGQRAYRSYGKAPQKRRLHETPDSNWSQPRRW